LLGAQIFGCTDNQATNYNPQATVNDGSCIYGQTINRPDDVCNLQPDLKETSALEFVDNVLISLNDSDNDAIIYTFDPESCQEIKTNQVFGTSNIDWEELATYKGKIYIGDFGNNAGRRRNLRIFVTDSTYAPVDTILFNYEDQKTFIWADGKHPYDCEAMFVDRDSIHLFTKDRLYSRTRHYRLPITPGNHEAQLIDSFFVDGLITAADISDNGIIGLLGYRSSGAVFQYLLFDYLNGQYFSGNKREILLGSGLDLGQAESIVFDGNYNYYISNEANFGLEARLFLGSCKKFTDHITSIEDEEVNPHIYKYQNQIYIDLQRSKDISWNVYDLHGRIISSGHQLIQDTHTILLPDTSTSIYFIELTWKENNQRRRKVYSFFN